MYSPTPVQRITLASTLRFFSTDRIATRIEKEILAANQYEVMYGSWFSESDVKLLRKYLPTRNHLRHLLHEQEAAVREIAEKLAHDGFGQYKALRGAGISMKSCYLVQTAVCLFLIARNSETLEEAEHTMANLRLYKCSVWASVMQPYVRKEVLCAA